jgi:hypothetical protein
MNPASILMTQRKRRPPAQLAGLEFMHHMQVGVAGTGAAHPDDHLSRTRRGIGDFDKHRIRLPLHQPQRSHSVLLP